MLKIDCTPTSSALLARDGAAVWIRWLALLTVNRDLADITIDADSSAASSATASTPRNESSSATATQMNVQVLSTVLSSVGESACAGVP